MPTRIDMSTYARRAHFEYFLSMGYPYVGSTVEVDVTPLHERAKAQGESFFLHMLYAAGRAANDVPELRQRIEGNGILQYAHCLTSHTVMKPDGTYAYCQADPGLSWPEFYAQTSRRQALAREQGGLAEEGDLLELLFVSCLPWVHYTALVQPVPFPADSNPRITWGKYEQQDGRVRMPVTLLAHHALVDGIHIGRFYEALADRMREED